MQTRRDDVFVLSVPIGAWTPALPVAVASLLAQTVPLRLAILNASGDARVDEALAPLQPLTGYRRDGADDGQSAAIQEGWQAVQGGFYGWLNADDFLFPDALARIARRFAETPEADLVTGQSVLVSPDTHSFGQHPAIAEPGPLLARTNTIAQPSTFVRREALDRIGGLDTGLVYTMDWDLWVRLQSAGARFAMLEDTLSGAVVTPDAKTSQFNARRAAEIFRLVKRQRGALAAAKSVLGTWQYHRSSQHGETTAALARAEDGRLRAGAVFTRAASTDFVLYDRPLHAVTLEGEGRVSLRLGTGPAVPVSCGERLALYWPQGEAGRLELTPIGGPVRVDLIRFE